MELHRDTMRVIKQVLLITGIGVFLILLPTLIGLFNVRFVFGIGTWLCYGLGGITVLAGVVRLAMLRPFQFSLDGAGVTVRSDQLNGSLPWSEIFAITVERAPHETPGMSPSIVLYPAEGSAWLARARYTNKGHKGFPISPIDEFKESPEQIIAGLSQLAGTRFALVDRP